MANTVWFKGIDPMSSPGNQTALSGNFFVDGSVAVSGDGSIDNPWKTIGEAINSVPNGTGNINDIETFTYEPSIVINVASGYYLEPQVPRDRTHIWVRANINKTVFIQGADLDGNGRGIFSADDIGNGFQISNVRYTGIIGVDTWFAQGGSNHQIDDCIWYGSRSYNGALTGKASADKCIFIESLNFGCDFGHEHNNAAGVTDIRMRRCTAFGVLNIRSALNASSTSAANIVISVCDLGSGVRFLLNDAQKSSGSISITNCNLRTTQFFNRTTSQDEPLSNYNNVTDSDNIDSDPLYLGNQNNFEFLISQASPLIGAGQNNSTIGALELGEVVDLSSPAENNDIDVGPPIVLIGLATTGNIKPTYRVFDQIRVSPHVGIVNGLPNNTDNVPDNESTTRIPNRRTLNVAWKETVGGAILTGEFIYGQRMFKDNNGNYTGSDDFDISHISSTGDLNNPDEANQNGFINTIDVAEIQENFVLNDQ